MLFICKLLMIIYVNEINIFLLLVLTMFTRCNNKLYESYVIILMAEYYLRYFFVN